jgi:hypothetical protein
VAQGVQDEGSELAVGFRVAEAGTTGDVAPLDGLHRVGHHLGGEADVYCPEDVAGDAVLDKLADPVGGDPGIPLVHRARGREGGHVVQEGPAGRP